MCVCTCVYVCMCVSFFMQSKEECDQLQASLELRKEEKDFKDQQLAAMKSVFMLSLVLHVPCA